MWNILTFSSFIAQNVLIVFYYLGAIVIPAVLYYYKDDIVRYLGTKEEKIGTGVFIVAFFCMELCWRMMFEAMIGYFDMHDYLYEISKKL